MYKRPFRAYIEESVGLPDTRSYSLDNALSVLHRSICHMDFRWRDAMWKHHPEIMKAAQLYAEKEQGGLAQIETPDWLEE